MRVLRALIAAQRGDVVDHVLERCTNGPRSTNERAVSAAEVTAARHLAQALRTHRVRVERDGGAVPESVLVLERLARFRVTAGQDGSGNGGSAPSVDDHGVTQRLLTYRQTADALVCSESTVKRLVAAGELPCVHIGGAVRVRVSDLDRFVAGLGDPAATPPKEPAC